MHRSRPSKNTLALLAACLSSLMFGLEISSIPAILPTLERLLHGGFNDMQWVMNAYTIACTTVLVATGTLADRFGRKRVFVVSITLFGVMSLLCGFASNMAVLIAGRFLQGASGGAMLICQVAVLSHQFRQGRERVNAFAAWGIIFGIGLGFGPIIGSATIALAGWQWVFLVHVPLALGTIELALAGVSESRDPHAQRLDTWGILTLSLAVFGIAFTITQGPDMGFTSLPALGIVAASAACLVAFFAAEHLNAHPMFDFSVFRIRNFSGALIGSAAMNFSFWPCMIYLPVYFHNALGYDDLMSPRMIALAINIALMGFILVAGVDAYLSRAVSGVQGTAQVHAFGEAIAAGHAVAIDPAIAHDALVHGFGWVMLYGGVGVWMLAAASSIVFGAARTVRNTATGA